MTRKSRPPGPAGRSPFGLGVIAAAAVVAVALLAWQGGDEMPTTEPLVDGADAPAVPADTTEEDAAAATTEADAAEPTFDVVIVTAEGETVVAGRAEPGAEVQVQADGETVATATADEHGEFVVVPEQPLGSGTQTLTLLADTATAEPVESAQSVVVDVPGDGTGEAGTMVAEVSVDAAEPTSVVQNAGVGLAGAGDLVLDAIDLTDLGDLAVSGRATPGAQVLVYVDGQLIADARADDAGHWGLARAVAIADPTAAHEVRVDMVDGAGTVIDRVASAFVGSDLFVPPPESDVVVIRPGHTLWHIARRTYGGGIKYTLIYRANQDKISDPDLIYPGQVFVLPADPEG